MHLFSLPTELLMDITESLDSRDMFSCREVSKRMCLAAATAFRSSIQYDSVIYPRRENMERFLERLDIFPHLVEEIEELDVVRDTISAYQGGYDRMWYKASGFVQASKEDEEHMDTIKRLHQKELAKNTMWIMNGSYAKTLTKILGKLTHLKLIKLRELEPREHIPGWLDFNMLKQFSFWHDQLDFNCVFYGGYCYDSRLNAITYMLDEFTDDPLLEYGARLIDQHGFPEDFLQAYTRSRTNADYSTSYGYRPLEWDIPCTVSHDMLATIMYGRPVF